MQGVGVKKKTAKDVKFLLGSNVSWSLNQDFCHIARFLLNLQTLIGLCFFRWHSLIQDQDFYGFKFWPMATNLNSLGLTRQSHFKPYFSFYKWSIETEIFRSEDFFETWLISICLFLKDDVLLKSVLKNEFFLSLTILFHRSLWRQHRRRLWKSLSWSWARTHVWSCSSRRSSSSSFRRL